MNRIDYILGDFVKFPRTEILAVPPKDSSLEEQRHKNRKTKEYSPFKDIEIAPAKRRFAEKEKETLDFLTDELVTSEEVFEHRNRKLFFVKGSWQHLNVKQFVDGLQKFVSGLPDLNPKNRTFFAGPNYVRRPEVDEIRGNNPTSPFIYLRLHNLIRAASAREFRPVTNYSDDTHTTKNGFNESTLIASIWSPNARLIEEVLNWGDQQDVEDIVYNMRNDHASTMSMSFFDRFVLSELQAKGRRDLVGYGFTKKFADALYAELEKVAEKYDKRIPQFSMLFPSKHDTTHDSGRSVLALSRADGNLY